MAPDDIFRPRRRGRGFGLIRWLRRTAAVGTVLIVLGSVMFGALYIVTPSVSDAEGLAQAQARAHHAVFPGGPVPSRFAASLIATEDHRFYSEPGIDPVAIGRVSLASLRRSGDQGGATLYQQLAKLLYTPANPGLDGKVEQVMLAIKLDISYSKAQILQMYADVAYFGHGFYGLTAASCGYFGVSPAHLSWAQAAMLAGLVQAPSADDPLTYPARARARQVHVLGRLVATQMLTRAQAGVALGQPLLRLAAKAASGCGNSG